MSIAELFQIPRHRARRKDGNLTFPDTVPLIFYEGIISCYRPQKIYEVHFQPQIDDPWLQNLFDEVFKIQEALLSAQKSSGTYRYDPELETLVPVQPFNADQFDLETPLESRYGAFSRKDLITTQIALEKHTQELEIAGIRPEQVHPPENAFVDISTGLISEFDAKNQHLLPVVILK